MENLEDYIKSKANLFKADKPIQPIHSGIIRHLWDMFGKNFSPNYTIDKLANTYINYFSTDNEKLKGKGLIILGSKGIGKTLNFLIYQRVRASNGEGMNVMCLEVKEIEHMFKMKGQSFIDEMRNVPELIINDVGTDSAAIKQYGSSVELINEILLLRYIKWQKVGGAMRTHISSNLEPEQFKTMYGDRIYDRIKEMFWLIVSENNESYRK